MNGKFNLNAIFPQELINLFRWLGTQMIDFITLLQLHVYFWFWDIPSLRWMHYVFRAQDWIFRVLWVYLKLCWRIFVQIARFYPRVLRGCVRFILCYSLLTYLCSTPDISTKLPLLENILQNCDWLYDIASNFVDINICILRKMFENFCATPIEECNPIIGPILSNIINDSTSLIDKLFQFIGR